MTYRQTRRRFLEKAAFAGLAGCAVRPAAMMAAGDVPPYYQDRGWLVGCWTRPWANYDYRVGFDAVAEAGFKYVALTGAKTRTGRIIGVKTTRQEAVKVGEEAHQRGLSITVVYGGAVPLEKGPEKLRRMIDLCQAAGGWSVQLAHIGTENSYLECLNNVAACCDYAASKKIVLLLKPHGGTTGTGPQLRDAVRRVNHPSFTLMYDPGNIYFYSKGRIDPVDDCQSVLGLVTGMSVKDYRDNEVMLTPGMGQVRFSQLMKKLRQGGFTHGPMMIECLTPGNLKQTLTEAKKPKAFIEELVS